MAEVVRAETAPAVVRETPLRVKTRRLLGTTREVFSRGSTAIGAIIILALLTMAIFAPLIVPENPRGAFQMPRDLTSVAVPPGSEGHPLGTTRMGGDVLYGIVWGARLSLQLSIYVVAGAMLVGTIVGSAAGIIARRTPGHPDHDLKVLTREGLLPVDPRKDCSGTPAEGLGVLSRSATGRLGPMPVSG